MAPYDIDPIDFLNLIRNAKYVCTDSFHCSAFSILYKKEFYTFRRYLRKTKQSTNSRLDTLFKMIGISRSILKGNEEVKQCIKNCINYEVVYENLEIIRNKSYEYLEMALENKESTDL